MHTYKVETVEEALKLKTEGLSYRAIAKKLLVHYSTVAYWFEYGSNHEYRAKKEINISYDEYVKRIAVDDKSRSSYYYILGQYLGDGTISKANRTYKLRIFATDSYPYIKETIENNLRTMLPGNSICKTQKAGCTEIFVYSNMLPLLFPQHGPGKKHDRIIELSNWQKDGMDHASLLKGLFHSDGCYHHTKGSAVYNFVNCSTGIIKIYESCLCHLGIEYKTYKRPLCNGNTQAYRVMVHRKEDVTKMYDIVGEKDGGNSNIPKPHYLSLKTPKNDTKYSLL